MWSGTTYKENSLGLTTEDILNKGNRSEKSTWQNFYNKEIKQSKQAFFQESMFPTGTLRTEIRNEQSSIFICKKVRS